MGDRHWVGLIQCEQALGVRRQGSDFPSVWPTLGEQDAHRIVFELLQTRLGPARQLLLLLLGCVSGDPQSDEKEASSTQ